MPWVTYDHGDGSIWPQLLAKVRERQYPQAEAKILYYLTKAGKPDEREDCERQLVERFGASTYSLESKLRIAARQLSRWRCCRKRGADPGRHGPGGRRLCEKLWRPASVNAMYMMGTMLSAMAAWRKPLRC
jgi:hypothetical protein